MKTYLLIHLTLGWAGILILLFFNKDGIELRKWCLRDTTGAILLSFGAFLLGSIFGPVVLVDLLIPEKEHK